MNMHSMLSYNHSFRSCITIASWQLLHERICFKTNKDVDQLIRTNFSTNQNHPLHIYETKHRKKITVTARLLDLGNCSRNS